MATSIQFVRVRLFQILSIFLLILLSSFYFVPLYFGWMGPSNQYESFNAFPGVDFDLPTGFYQPPTSDDYNYVIQQGGKIKIFENTPTVQDSHVFLDLSDRVFTSSEDGLLGLAFHPQFDENGKFYTYHSENHETRYPNSDCNPCYSTLLSEFTVDPDNPLAADIGSERTLIEINQTNAFHRGGQLNFGSDGYLYVQIGDGTYNYKAQSLDNFWGKILRIDVNNQSSELPYAIPSDNPFVDKSGAKGEIWAYGLRNPWRGSFDPVTGNLWVGDVGKDYYEEIDIITKGQNYGWPVYEGDICKDNQPECSLDNTTSPILSYPHPANIPISTSDDDPSGVAVIGGHVYRGEQLTDLQGDYIFADYTGSIYQLTYDANYEVVSTQFLHKTTDYISQIGVDNDNEIYITSIYRGNILKLRDSNQIEFYIATAIYILALSLLLWRNIRKLSDN